MIVAMIALFVALSGTAVATTSALITGNQIKNSSITGLDVKNRSLRPIDFRGSVRGPRGLRGLRGLTGAAGAAGAAGAKGDKGDIGPSDARFAQSGTDVLAWTGTPQTVQSLALPPGRWVVISKVLGNSNDASNPSVDCTLSAGATVIDDGFDSARVGAATVDDREYFTYFGTVELAADGTVTLECDTDAAASGNWLNRRIVAIRVGSLG